MNEEFLTTHELAKRWSLNPDTLKKWRGSGKGPPYHQIEGRIRYGLEELEVFEKNKLKRHTSTPEPVPIYVSKAENISTEIKLPKRKYATKRLSKNKRSRK